MGDSSRVASLTKKLEVPSIASSNKTYKRALVASTPKTFKGMSWLNNGGVRREYASHIAFFLLKVAALEVTRRFSKAKCPFVWRSLQAMQIICYPPFTWIQRWAPFRGLVMGMQQRILASPMEKDTYEIPPPAYSDMTLSKPMFFLSIATAFSDDSESYIEDTDETNDSQPCPEPPAGASIEDTSICDEAPQRQEPESWLLQLNRELEMQGITLPERINEDELRRFNAAANGNFSSLIPSIKKTIRWRESYKILSAEELEMWSNLVFWHGYDVKCRPCLIVRLGLACSSLASSDRPRFTQAVVSQVEHGILHLVNAEDPQITVVMDCEGLSPFKFPMQMMRSCSTLMQDNYPNRLGCLFVIRLPPVVRVIAQTFIQVLKPVTRKKLRIEGEMYKKVLSEYLQNVPSYLGGKCTCPKCSTQHNYDSWTRWGTEGSNMIDPNGDFTSDESPSVAGNPYLDLQVSGNCDHVLRTAIIAILMIWIFIGFLAGMYDPGLPFP